jgi:hypothetical protein
VALLLHRFCLECVECGFDEVSSARLTAVLHSSLAGLRYEYEGERMIRRGLGQHRRVFAGTLAIALLALALAVGVAQALAGTGTATSPIEKNNFTCGLDIGTSAIGSVTFTRDDKALREQVRLTKVSPSSKYDIFLNSGGCVFLKTLGVIKTNSSGAGEATFTSSTFGHQSFFVGIDREEGGGVGGVSVTVKV